MWVSNDRYPIWISIIFIGHLRHSRVNFVHSNGFQFLAVSILLCKNGLNELLTFSLKGVSLGLPNLDSCY